RDVSTALADMPYAPEGLKIVREENAVRRQIEREPGVDDLLDLLVMRFHVANEIEFDRELVVAHRAQVALVAIEGAGEFCRHAGDTPAAGIDQGLRGEEAAAEIVGPDRPAGKLAGPAVDEHERVAVEHHLHERLQRQHAKAGKDDG